MRDASSGIAGRNVTCTPRAYAGRVVPLWKTSTSPIAGSGWFVFARIAVVPRRPLIDRDELASWCREQFGCEPVAELFRAGYLSAVAGLRLLDGREVVVKVRAPAERLAGCFEVQRRLFDSGFRCPEPLIGPTRLGDYVATAEQHVPGGSLLPASGRASTADRRSIGCPRTAIR